MNFLQIGFEIAALAIFIPGLFVNYFENFIPAAIIQFVRYGRANVNSKISTFKSIEVPKSWFAHFYLYAVALQATIFYNLIKLFTNSNPTEATADSRLAQILSVVGGEHRPDTIDVTTTTLASFLFLIHLIRRLYETWFVSIYSGTKMNVFHYVLAFLHYTGAALSLVNHSIGLTGHTDTPTTSPLWKLCYKHLTFWHTFGLILFLYGSYQQNKAHHQYADLRKGKKGNKAVNYAHGIPQGGLFEKVSCPNYWAEIIIYTSFCVLFNLNNPTWNYVTLWVYANQIISGVMNHMWYKKTFPDYPKNRKAIIPYVW